MLTEDFLTVLSAVDEDLMIKLLRAQTRDGGTVIDFLDNVMHGREDGFRVNHRISAARELISHILRDEHAFAHAVLDNLAAHIEPAPYDDRRADPRVRPLPGSETPSPSTPPLPRLLHPLPRRERDGVRVTPRTQLPLSPFPRPTQSSFRRRACPRNRPPPRGAVRGGAPSPALFILSLS